MRATTEHPAQHERAAARRYLEHDYAAERLSGPAREQANHHAQAIDEEHPRARDIAMTGTPRELGDLPKHLRAHQRSLRTRAGISTEHAARIRQEYRTRPYAEDDEESSGSGAPTARERAIDAASRTSALAASAAGAAADTSWGSLVGDFLLWGVALSLGYLMITRVAGVGKLFEGATNVARAVISPVVDPLNPKGALK